MKKTKKIFNLLFLFLLIGSDTYLACAGGTNSPSTESSDVLNGNSPLEILSDSKVTLTLQSASQEITRQYHKITVIYHPDKVQESNKERVETKYTALFGDTPVSCNDGQTELQAKAGAITDLLTKAHNIMTKTEERDKYFASLMEKKRNGMSLTPSQQEFYTEYIRSYKSEEQKQAAHALAQFRSEKAKAFWKNAGGCVGSVLVTALTYKIINVYEKRRLAAIEKRIDQYNIGRQALDPATRLQIEDKIKRDREAILNHVSTLKMISICLGGLAAIAFAGYALKNVKYSIPL